MLFTRISSKSQLKKLLKKGRLSRNGTTLYSADRLQAQDLIQLTLLPSQLPSYPLPLTIAYEDPHLAAVVKPADLPTSGNARRTLTHALAHNLATPELEDALDHPQPVHRLDRHTHGLVLVARSRSAQQALATALAEHRIEKTYRAIVIGQPPISGDIHLPIDGKTAHTTIQTIATYTSPRFGLLSAVDLSPITGRTHQLRIHMARLGHPIIGDRLYCPENLLVKGKGLFLAAYQLHLTHPITGQDLDISIDLPKKFSKISRNA